MPRALLPLLAACLPLLASPGRVAVSGEVQHPGHYPLPPGGTVAQLVAAAGGLTPDAGAVALLRLADSPTVTVRVTLPGRTADPLTHPDTPLAPGDRVLIPRAGADAAPVAVEVAGFVARPGPYALPAGSGLADLLMACGGPLPGALPQATWHRVGGPVITVDLTAERPTAAEPPLADGDRLEVASGAAWRAPDEARVTVSGEVHRPGLYPRYRAMRLSDALRAAGGLTLGADRDRIWVERLTATGRLRRLAVAPLEALAGEAADVELADGDVIQVPGLAVLRPGAEPITAAGEVYTPGSWALFDGATVGDLLRLAGGPTPRAWRSRALLRRRGADGRLRQIPIDLGRRPLSLPLEAGDQLDVLAIEQAVYTEPTVRIRGDVRYPGSYERTLGMRLSDLVWVAGGLTRNLAFMSCEVARARSTEVVILRPALEPAMAGEPQHDLELADGDQVIVQTLGEDRPTVTQVRLLGEIRQPGAYPLRSDHDSLRELLERAGGLLPEADPDGVLLLRRVDQVVHPDVQRYVTELYAGMLRKQMAAFGVYLAQTRAGAHPELFATTPTGLAGEVEPAWVEALARQTTRLPLAEQTRLLADRDTLGRWLLDDEGRLQLAPGQVSEPPSPGYFRVALDLPAVLAGRLEVTLRPDDLLIASRRSHRVLVFGEVIGQRALLHQPGAPLADYLALCGGLSRDADPRRFLRLRPNGQATPVDHRAVPAAGDIILVMPRVYDAAPRRGTLQDLSKGLRGLLNLLATHTLSITR